MSATPTTRSRASIVADRVVGILLALLALGLLVVFWAQFTQLQSLSMLCQGIAADGSVCNPATLSTTLNIAYGVLIFAFGLSVGMFIVRAIQTRLAWFWPLIGVIAIYATYWVVAAVLSGLYLPPSA